MLLFVKTRDMRVVFTPRPSRRGRRQFRYPKSVSTELILVYIGAFEAPYSKTLLAELVALNDDSFAHTAADAHGSQTDGQVALDHFVDQGGGDAAKRLRRSGDPERLRRRLR